MEYYNGTKLLSMRDINGEKPEIYMCTSNRSAGKTTYFSRLVVNRFLERKEKFMLIYRFNYELDNVADKFFKDINGLFFPKSQMLSYRQARGIYHLLELDGEECGYACALNNADQLKRYSHFFSDTACMMFDEFQSETNHYCPNEITKFQSLHTSVARGQGKQYRYLPVYMIGNPVTLLNPYYTAMNISSRLNEKTHFLRGEGFVLEQGFVESASLAQKQSGFNKAFKSEVYTQYSTEGLYLNDSLAFIEKIEGKAMYMMTLRYNNRNFGVLKYPDLGIVYCSDKYDSTHKIKISVTTEDHQPNYVMLKGNNIMIDLLRYYFTRGCMRFKNPLCKECILAAISY